MSFQQSPFHQSNANDDFEYEDDQNDEFMDDLNEENAGDDSEEDTEEASETEMGPIEQQHPKMHGPRITDEPNELKEQVYQDKLARLQKELDELKGGSHPEFLRRVKKLEHQYHERIRLNEIYRDYLINCVERDYILEKNAAVKDYEEKKIDLKDNLVTDFEDRRKMIESERQAMELTSDSIDIKPTVTRKLRRRPNDPVPVQEKRRKPTTGQLVLLLDDKEVENDLKLISRGKAIQPTRPPSNSSSMNGMSNNSNNQPNYMANNGNLSSDNGPAGGPMSSSSAQLVETKIEDGKLLYERRWFHRGQPVYVEGKDIPRFSAHISAIGSEAIWVKKADGQKVRIFTTQLSRGKVSIKRRAN